MIIDSNKYNAETTNIFLISLQFYLILPDLYLFLFQKFQYEETLLFMVVTT